MNAGSSSHLFASGVSALSVCVGLACIALRKGKSTLLSRERLLLGASLAVAAIAAHIFISLRASLITCSHSLRVLLSLSRLLTGSAILLRAKELRPNSRFTEAGTLLGVALVTLLLPLVDISGVNDVAAACAGNVSTAHLWIYSTALLQPMLLAGCAVRAGIIVYDGADASDEQHNKFSALLMIATIIVQFFFSAALAVSSRDSLAIVPLLLVEVCASPALLLASHVEVSFEPKAPKQAASTPDSNVTFKLQESLHRLHPHRRAPSSVNELPTVIIDHSAFTQGPPKQTPRHLRLSSVDVSNRTSAAVSETASQQSFESSVSTPVAEGGSGDGGI